MYEYIGPFFWVPSHTGHRCLIARAKFVSEDPDDVEGQSVPEDNRYTQRNLQEVGADNSFKIVNPSQYSAAIEIEFDARTLPMAEPGSSVALTVEYNAALYAAWTDVSGTSLTTNSEGDIVLHLYGNRIRLPAANLPGLIRLDASVDMSPPTDIEDTFEVYFAEYVNDVLSGGMSFQTTNVIIE
jgi:hypothetical protein